MEALIINWVTGTITVPLHDLSNALLWHMQSISQFQFVNQFEIYFIALPQKNALV